MILVDSSVWIDYFNGVNNAPADKLDTLLSHEPLAIGDLILTEVLQGFSDERAFNEARKMLSALVIVELVGEEDRDSGGAELQGFTSSRRYGS